MGGTYLSLNQTQRDHKEANVHLFVWEGLEIYYLTDSFLFFICLPEDTFVLCFNWKYKPWKKYNVPEQNLPPKF